jgi:hypothetical protein
MTNLQVIALQESIRSRQYVDISRERCLAIIHNIDRLIREGKSAVTINEGLGPELERKVTVQESSS